MPATLLKVPRPFVAAPSAVATEQFANDVRQGLGKSPKELPAKYLYNEVGSALFDVITLLPEYGLTRADERLLRQNARTIALRLAPGLIVAELGSGSGRKTRPILEAIGLLQRSVNYYAIDGSPTALERCRKELSGIPGAHIHTLDCFYEQGLERVAECRSHGERLLVLFLGSSIGNFERAHLPDFLNQLRRQLLPGDAVLVGADLEKPPRQLLQAYDDPAGVTAAFDLNVLARMNRELGANFDLHRFRHEARWSESNRRIEMHLRSLVRQTVDIEGAGVRASFGRNESLWTESSHKFSAGELSRLARAAGFMEEAQWIDPEWPFAENLWIVP